ncbi:MAG: AAA family ATPase, partial [Pseudomonadota bacterium]
KAAPQYANGPQRDWVVAAFASRLHVQRVRTTLLISINFQATDPVKAATIANAIAEAYLEKQLNDKKRLANYASEKLEEQLEDMRLAVMQAERKVEHFKAANGIFASEGQILSEKQLARLMEQTILARNETAKARAKYEQARKISQLGTDTASLASVLDSNTIRLLRVQLAETTRKRAELETKYGPRHPEILKIQAKVRDARADLDAEIDRLVKGLKNLYTEAQNREEELQADLANQQTREVAAKDQTVRLKELEREAQSSRQLFEALLQRYKITAGTRDLQLPDSRLVETAGVPLFASSPNRKKLVMIAAFGALGLGLLIALALEFATTGLGRPEDAEAVLEVPHLSSLPLLDPKMTNDPVRLARMTISDPDNDFVSAIRKARRELDLTAPRQTGRIILVSSALPGEGSSLVASNLAHHYALTGQRVLLIDTDVRRASLSQQLAPNSKIGLSNVLMNGHGPETAILQDTRTNLCFMPAVGSPPVHQFNPEHLAAPVFQNAMAQIRTYFDVIIMDTPPVLPVIDTQFLADQADQIVVVMTWRKTPRALAKKAIQTLGPNRSKISGVIVNRVAPEIIQQTRGTPALERMTIPAHAA